MQKNTWQYIRILYTVINNITPQPRVPVRGRARERIMITRTDGKCDACGKELKDSPYEETHTILGKDFCDYSCMETYYGDDIPENEDFIIVPR